MARGRLLNKSVSASLKFHNLPDDTCRLMATWIIAHLDKNGVFYADPGMVRSIVFPRRTDISIEQITTYLVAIEEIGLMYRFQAKGDLWQCWPGFDDNQPALNKERESSEYPEPPTMVDNSRSTPELLQSGSGVNPELLQNDSGMTPAQYNIIQSNLIKDHHQDNANQDFSPNGEGANAPAAPEQKPPGQTCEFDTPGSRVLQAKLTENAKAIGRAGPRRFKSLQQKREFLASEQRLGVERLTEAIDVGLTRGINSVDRLVSWSAKFGNGKNGSGSGPPRASPESTKPRPEPVLEHIPTAREIQEAKSCQKSD